MSLARRQALISLLIWSMVLTALVALFLHVGPERFSDPSFGRYRLAAAAIILPGYVAYFWSLWRSRRGRSEGELDERDALVARRASEVTLVVVSVVIFSASIVLWEAYRDAGAAPAGWFHLVAYGTVALVSLVHAGARLLVDAAGPDDG